MRTVGYHTDVSGTRVASVAAPTGARQFLAGKHRCLVCGGLFWAWPEAVFYPGTILVAGFRRQAPEWRM